MKISELLFILWFSFVPSVLSLQCYAGANVDAGSLFQFSSWNLTQCETTESSRCLRAETVFITLGIFKGKLLQTDSCEGLDSSLDLIALGSYYVKVINWKSASSLNYC